MDHLVTLILASSFSPSFFQLLGFFVNFTLKIRQTCTVEVLDEYLECSVAALQFPLEFQ
jgi:hypothetical protein